MIPTYTGKIPFLTTEQMIEVDRAMVHGYKIELMQMMENAGHNLAHLARVRFLENNPVSKKVTVLAGTGGNGGGALVCARRLHNYGGEVKVYVTKTADNFTPIPAHQLDILQRMKVPIARADSINNTTESDLIIDGVIGYSLKGAPRDEAATLIRWANASNTPVLALDAPSGVDTTTGTVFNPAIKATATMTLALPKEGLRARGVESYVGELYLADISIPPELYTEPAIGLTIGPIFAQSDIIRIKLGKTHRKA